MNHLHYLEREVARLDCYLIEAMKPYAWAWRLLQTIPGIDEISAALILIEIGDDIESVVTFRLLAQPIIGHTAPHEQTRPTLAQISAQFTGYDVERSGGGYIILNRGTSDPIARPRPIPDTDRFELFHWSNVKGRWKTFGNMGRMKLMLESAHEMTQQNWPKSSLGSPPYIA